MHLFFHSFISFLYIDEACTWYKLPNTTSVIATAAGITLTAAATNRNVYGKAGYLRCDKIRYGGGASERGGI